MVFDTTEEFTAKAVVVINAELQTNAEASIVVVDKIVRTVNSDDEETEILTAFIDGAQTQIIAETSGLLVNGEGNKQMETDDIIQYKTNADGEIVKVRVLFDISSKGTELNETPVEDFKIIYGKVVKKFTSTINIKVHSNCRKTEKQLNFGWAVFIMYQFLKLTGETLYFFLKALEKTDESL